jgi:hypothetical protein
VLDVMPIEGCALRSNLTTPSALRRRVFCCGLAISCF